jgi:hypothetical protein
MQKTHFESGNFSIAGPVIIKLEGCRDFRKMYHGVLFSFPWWRRHGAGGRKDVLFASNIRDPHIFDVFIGIGVLHDATWTMQCSQTTAVAESRIIFPGSKT